MENILFEHNLKAYEAAILLMQETGRAAVIHPTGTGKSFIAFKLCADNKNKKICWLSPSEYIYRTQEEKWLSAGGDKCQNIRFFTYAKLIRM
ncbi:MAG: DEAD/DEAH box helicase family protein, partial [Lachnospiraceae bacterium]|nr:DEAD/DEAH box helicase family protein [Lachnospiraceae bacterium]